MKFDPGLMVITPGADKFLEDHSIKASDLMDRHLNGDWGDLDQSDKALNEESLSSGARIMSAYAFGEKKVWVITEATNDEGKREATTVLLPEEY